MFYENVPYAWCFWKQSEITQSTIVAEYITAAQFCQMMECMRYF